MPFYGSDDDYGYDYVNSELFRARSNTSKTMFSIRGGEVSAVQPGRVYHEKLRRGNLSARPVRVDDPAPIWTTIPEKYIGYKIAPDGYHYDDSEEHLYKRRRQPIYRDAERRRTIYREQAWVFIKKLIINFLNIYILYEKFISQTIVYIWKERYTRRK